MTNKIVPTVIMIIMSFNFHSCSKDPEPLGMDRVWYTGDELRMDGYYYYDYPTSKPEYREIWFLYTNGIAQQAGAQLSELDAREQSFRDGSFYARTNDRRNGWGVFQVQNNMIKINHWRQQAGSGRWITRSDIGEITSKESFMVGGKAFQFKQFYPKLDSICRFIP